MATTDAKHSQPAAPAAAMHTPLERHWMPDERDAFILWLRGEFAAANAIIDALCRHLQLVGQPGEYDFAFTCIQQRRYNWTVVLHMQQYYSVAEVVMALQQVVWRKQQQQQLQQQQGINPPAPDHHPAKLPLPVPLHLHPAGLVQPEDPQAAIAIPQLPPADPPPQASSDPDSLDPAPQAASASSKSPPVPAPAPHRGDHNIPAQQQQLEELDVQPQVQVEPQPGPELNKKGSASAQDTAQEEQIRATAPVDSTTPPALHQANNKEHLHSNKQASPQELSPDPPGQNSVPPHDKRTPQVPSTPPLLKAKSLDASHTFYEQLEPTQHTSSNPSGYFLGAEFQFSSTSEEERRQSLVKATKNYSCIEIIEGKPINVVEGLELFENVFDDSETSRLLSVVNDLLSTGKRGRGHGSRRWQKDKGREILQFGLPRSDNTNEDDKQSPSLVKDEAGESVSGFFLAVVERLVRWHIIPASKRPDFCSINVSEEGEYIRPNGDHHNCDRPFCTLSISTECTMVFGRFLKMDRPGEFNGPFKLSVPPGSVVVLQGNSVDVARSAIPTLSGRRISITFGRRLVNKSSKANQSLGSSPSTSWTSPSRQGISGSPGPISGSPNRGGLTPFKAHNFAPTSGVLPVPPIRPAGAVPQASAGIQPLFSSTSPHSSGFSGLQALSPAAWSTASRPARPPSAGTGVFFPSSGSPSGPGRPVPAANQRRQGLAVAPTPTLQKTASSPASFPSLDGPPPSSPSPPPSSSGKPAKSTGSGPSTPQSPEVLLSPTHDGASGSKPGGGREAPGGETTVKSESNGTRAGKEEHAGRSGRPKSVSANRVPLVLVGSQSQAN